MPAGDLYTREIRSSEPPEDLHRRVVLQLSPLLAPAKYKLAAEHAQSVEYSRRYFPTAALLLVLAALVAAALAVAAGVDLVALALGGLGVVGLLFARRSEALTVLVQPRPGGSTAVLSGHLTGRARMFVAGFDPPRTRTPGPAGAHVVARDGLPSSPSAR